MRSILLLTILSALFLLQACNKCEKEVLTCNERPPTNELCLAYFTRWFYDSSSKKCEQIGYSGCSEVGFSSEQECEACDCK